MRLSHPRSALPITAICVLLLLAVTTAPLPARAAKTTALQPAAVTCVYPPGNSREDRIELAPAQDPKTACPRGAKPRAFIYYAKTLSAAVRNGPVDVYLTYGLPPPRMQQNTGGGH